MSSTDTGSTETDLDGTDGASGGGAPARHRHVRWLVIAGLAVAWVVLLFTVIFPLLEGVLNTDPTLDVDTPATDVGELPDEG